MRSYYIHDCSHISYTWFNSRFLLLGHQFFWEEVPVWNIRNKYFSYLPLFFLNLLYSHARVCKYRVSIRHPPSVFASGISPCTSPLLFNVNKRKYYSRALLNKSQFALTSHLSEPMQTSGCYPRFHDGKSSFNSFDFKVSNRWFHIYNFVYYTLWIY